MALVSLGLDHFKKRFMFKKDNGKQQWENLENMMAKKPSGLEKY